MIDSLAVAADQLDGTYCDAMTAAALAHRARVKLAEPKIQARDGGRGGGCVGNGQDGLRHRFGIGGGVKGGRAHPLARDVHDGDVDAVERGAAHDAGYSHERFSSCCSSLSKRSASTG